MLSKNKIKQIQSLDQKKNRIATGLFVAEGKKLVFDLVHEAMIPEELFCLKELAPELEKFKTVNHINIVDIEEIKKISFLKTPPEIVAVFKIRKEEIEWDQLQKELILVLDAIQDPGNLGTIVRLADWFGIRDIICSETCADIYNPKSIQSTMGALARVKIHYAPLPQVLEKALSLKIPVYGTFLEGENIYKCDLTTNGMVVMGNEGKGISDLVSGFVSRKINIPSFPPGEATSESLNVAIATSIICSEFRRRVICKD